MKNPADQELADRLKTARSRLFDTAAEAARALDMKPVTVRAHESGQNNPNYFDLERYARRYGVSLQWLLTGKGDVEPTADAHVITTGEPVPIMAAVQDGSWLKRKEGEHGRIGYGLRKESVSGQPEFANFDDPRFPADVITGVRVITDVEDGPYINGTVLFTIGADEIGYRVGDHVVIYTEEGDFAEWSLRKVAKSADGKTQFEALTSDALPLVAALALDDDKVSRDVVAVVVGSLTRRPVPTPTLEVRKAIEGDLRQFREMFPGAGIDATKPAKDKA